MSENVKSLITELHDLVESTQFNTKIIQKTILSVDEVSSLNLPFDKPETISVEA